MSAAICGTAPPHIAEFIIGRAFARPGGSCGLRLLIGKKKGTSVEVVAPGGAKAYEITKVEWR